MLTVAPAKAQTDAEAVQQLSGRAQEILASVNQQRVNHGLNALVLDPLLTQAAQHHVNDMLANYNYTHRGSDGSTVKMRVARTGYSADPWVSENWVSSRSVEGAMRWWMNDYIHRVNILTPRWREIGVGVASRPNTGEMIFVTVFATGRGEPSAQPSVVPAAQPTPAPAPLPTVDVPPGGMDYTIRSGDTLLGIANRHSLNWRVVAAGNGLNEHSILQIGQVIRLPGVESSPVALVEEDDTTGATASTEDNAGFEQTGADAAPTIETEPYTVESGDTLFSIAARNGITWQELAALNNFREHDYLQIGQNLQVPKRKTNGVTNGESPSSSLAENDTPERDSAPDQVANGHDSTNGSNGNFVVREYTPLVALPPNNGEQTATAEAGFVQSGESVSTTKSPENTQSVAAAAQESPPQAMHVVQSGDTIFGIAVQHGVDWQALLQVNGLSEQSILQPGQEIKLP